MRAAIDQFRVNIGRVRNLGTLYKVLRSQTTDALELSDMLRAELVLAVSALDHYVHEIVRLGMLRTYRGGHVQTPAFLRFQVSLESTLAGIAAPASDGWLVDQITTCHGYQSFQSPDRIAKAVRLISDAQLWDEVAAHLGLSAQGVKEKLTLIVNRRNQIAHEADMDPSYPGARWPINENTVDDAISFLYLCRQVRNRIKCPTFMLMDYMRNVRVMVGHPGAFLLKKMDHIQSR